MNSHRLILPITLDDAGGIPSVTTTDGDITLGGWGAVVWRGGPLSARKGSAGRRGAALRPPV